MLQSIEFAATKPKLEQHDMRAARILILLLLVCSASLVVRPEANATEYGLSTYGLGQNAFGAGVTPPAGTYLTSATSFYNGKIGSSVEFGGVNISIGAGAHLEFLSTAINGLYVFDHKVLGGNLGISATVPVGYVNIDAAVTIGPLTAQRTTDGFGLGDIVSKLQLGWQHGTFSHTLYVQTVAPTGRYDTGFSPNIGLNRPGIDTGWAFTLTDKATQLQFNGAVGVTFNFENTETNYKSGDEFHFEWAVGREVLPGLIVGLVGYDYRQLSADSGGPALLGSFKGQVDAIGVGMNGTTLLGGKTPLIINLRTYREFNADNHWEGNSSMATATIRF